MARESLLECSFLIPNRRDKRLSDCRLQSREAWAWLEARLRVFGGGTRARELYEGWYIDPQTKEQVKDLSHKYIVAVPASKLRLLRQTLAEACQVFQQKQIYLSVAGKVEFIEAGYGSS